MQTEHHQFAGSLADHTQLGTNGGSNLLPFASGKLPLRALDPIRGSRTWKRIETHSTHFLSELTNSGNTRIAHEDMCLKSFNLIHFYG